LRSMNRPLGVTLLAILHVLQAILALIIGLVLIALGAYLLPFLVGMPRFARHPGLLGIIGGIAIVMALLYLLLSYGLWTGKGWAWTISLILAGLGIIISLVGLILRSAVGAIITLILDALIIYYLTRINVKAYFGKAQPLAYPSTSQPNQQPPQMNNSDTPKFCVNCGAPAATGVKFCSYCGSQPG